MRSKTSATDTEFGGDDEVCKMIVDKFEQLGGEGVSYADIARRAWEVGRSGLATKVGCLNIRASARADRVLGVAFRPRVKSL